MSLQTSLLFGSVIAYAAAGLYAYVGTRMFDRRHDRDPGSRMALHFFVVWWLGIAASEAMTGTATLLAALGDERLAVQMTISYLYVLFISVALWGLIYYLVYLFTGRRGLLGPITLYYATAYISLVYYITASRPIGIDVRRWQATLLFEHPLEGPLFTFVLLLIVLPPILGAFGYFTLVFRLEDRPTRWRAGLVSWGILLWFLVTFLSAYTGFPVPDSWYLPSRLAGLIAAFMVLLAYHPPMWLTRHLGVARAGARGEW